MARQPRRCIFCDVAFTFSSAAQLAANYTVPAMRGAEHRLSDTFMLDPKDGYREKRRCGLLIPRSASIIGDSHIPLRVELSSARRHTIGRCWRDIKRLPLIRPDGTAFGAPFTVYDSSSTKQLGEERFIP